MYLQTLINLYIYTHDTYSTCINVLPTHHHNRVIKGLSKGYMYTTESKGYYIYIYITHGSENGLSGLLGLLRLSGLLGLLGLLWLIGLLGLPECRL